MSVCPPQFLTVVQLLLSHLAHSPAEYIWIWMPVWTSTQQSDSALNLPRSPLLHLGSTNSNTKIEFCNFIHFNEEWRISNWCHLLLHCAVWAAAADKTLRRSFHFSPRVCYDWTRWDQVQRLTDGDQLANCYDVIFLSTIRNLHAGFTRFSWCLP